LKKFKNKIIHIVVDDFPHTNQSINIKNGEQWSNEKFQRNCISRGLDKLIMKDTDLITICDLDEIPDPNVLFKLKNSDNIVDVSILELDFYYYNLNCKRVEKWYHTKILPCKKYRELNIKCDDIRFLSCPVIEKAGWHLSYFGDSEFIKNKLENFTHQEYNNDMYTNTFVIQNRIENGIDLFNRQNSDMINIDVQDNNYLPPMYDSLLQKYFKNSHRIKDTVIHIDNEILDNFNLINREYLVNESYYDSKSGVNEYRLYSYLSTFFNNTTILDIGTFDGRSAVALSHNETNKVISYNITDDIQNNRHKIYSNKILNLE